MNEKEIIELNDLEPNAEEVKGGQPPHVKVFSGGNSMGTTTDKLTDIIVGVSPGAGPHVK